MCKIDLRLLVLISSVSMQLHAADIVEGLEAAAKIAQAAEPLIKEGAAVVGEGIEAAKDHHHKSGKQPKIEDRVTALEKIVPLCVPQNVFDASQKAQEEEMGRLRAATPSAKHPHGFVLQDPNDPLVPASKLKAATAPLQADVQGLQASMGSHVTQQQLTDATAGNLKDDPENPYVKTKGVKDLVAGEMQGYITKDEIRNGVKASAGKLALGFSSYRLSWMIESLLQSAGMENRHVSLRDVSVPLTTLMVSFAARAGKEIYQTQDIPDVQTVAQKSLLDAATSAIVIALKNILFDAKMDAQWNECTENRKAAFYAAAVVPVSWMMECIAQS